MHEEINKLLNLEQLVASGGLHKVGSRCTPSMTNVTLDPIESGPSHPQLPLFAFSTIRPSPSSLYNSIYKLPSSLTLPVNGQPPTVST